MAATRIEVALKRIDAEHDPSSRGPALLEDLLQNGSRDPAAAHILLLDATDDGNPPGTLTRTVPRFSADYPPTLTAHDIGVKDLLDAFYMQSGEREVVLYAITIDPRQSISMDLSPVLAAAANEAVRLILEELNTQSA